MAAQFSVTGDTGGGAGVGFVMMSTWDVSVGQPGKAFCLEMGIKVRWPHERGVVRVSGREPGS